MATTSTTTSTGQVLGATTTTAGVAMLPATGETSQIVSFFIYAVLAMGIIVLTSFSAARAYKRIRR